MNRSTGTIPILLLAAGSSTRMGQSKQLLTIHGKPLLQRSLEVALEANTGKVIVVLGANEIAHRNIIKNSGAEIVINKNWKNGMGSSIKTGLTHIEKYLAQSTGVIISVCDQPHLSSKHLEAIVNTYHQSGNKIVASSYNDTLGVPIVFDRTMFFDLHQIKDDEGAKKIVVNNQQAVSEVPFPLGEIDLDTMEDYNTFNQ